MNFFPEILANSQLRREYGIMKNAVWNHKAYVFVLTVRGEVQRSSRPFSVKYL